MILFAAADTATGWSTAVNTWGVIALAIIQAFRMWFDKLHRQKAVKALEHVTADLGEVKTEVKSVKRSVDGPMGTALQTAATALALAAKATGDSDLILQAVAAQKESDAHKQNMKAVEEEARLDKQAKERVISEWKASQNPPIP